MRRAIQGRFAFPAAAIGLWIVSYRLVWGGYAVCGMNAVRRAQALGICAGGLTIALAVLVWQMRRLREAQRAAVAANGAKSIFLANMSHEIRTPLHGIIATAELLGRSGLNAEQREMALLVLHSTETLLTIVNDVLDFSKIEAGRMDIERISFDVRTAVEEVVRLYAARSGQKGLRIESRVKPDVPRGIMGDPLRVRQILMNLMSNAIKFTETGSVEIEVACAGTGADAALLFRVIDTGIGIAPEISRTLFRAFTQGESGAARKYGGAGLGLVISLRLVTLMGGSIGVESEPGKGSVFWFIIPAPAADPAQARADPPPRENAPASDIRVRVLVVEDNPVNQVVAARALRSLGYLTEIAPSGEEALRALEGGDFNLILMDCQMPGMDGYQTAAEIRRRETGSGRSVPIIAVTANSIEGDRERCAAAGMDDYLSKPFRMAALQAVLERWVTGAERSVA